MVFNPFAHMDELVFSNVFGGLWFGVPPQDTVTAPDGSVIPAAVQGHPDTITYWFPTNGVYQQITPTQAFAEHLWLHAAYGIPVGDTNMPLLQQIGLGYQLQVTDQQLEAAVLAMPSLLSKVIAAGVTEQQVLAYAHAEAPDVMIVGQPG